MNELKYSTSSTCRVCVSPHLRLMCELSRVLDSATVAHLYWGGWAAFMWCFPFDHAHLKNAALLHPGSRWLLLHLPLLSSTPRIGGDGFLSAVLSVSGMLFEWIDRQSVLSRRHASASSPPPAVCNESANWSLMSVSCSAGPGVCGQIIVLHMSRGHQEFSSAPGADWLLARLMIMLVKVLSHPGHGNSK